MAASPTARPAPFFRPFDFLDRGILLAESALSFVIVITMVLVAFLAAAAQLLGIDHPLLVRSVDVQMHGTIWAAFLGASFATR
ncbi:MAG: hypothetical protein KC417_16850, partial [Myxococcales bacterium]|nr:hypothetical protein [Myxococcales bacterium]